MGCQSAQSEKKIFGMDKKNQLKLPEHSRKRLCVRLMEKRASMSLLLGKRTTEPLDVLIVHPEKEEQVYTVTEQRNYVDIREKYPA